MKIRIKRNCLEETLLLILCLFYVLIAHWIWFGRGIQETVMILLSVIVLLKSKRNQYISAKQVTDVLLWSTLFAICLWGIVQAESHEYLVADLKSMVGSILVVMAFVAAIRKLTANGVDFLEFLFYILNGYVIINDIIIVVQSFVPYFLMNRSAISSVNNSLYFDQLSGFFGINGTTRWNLWTVVLIILNFYTGFQKNNKKIICYNLVLFFASILICMLNSARAFLIIAPITMLLYLFFIRKVSVTGRMKQIFLTIAALFVAFGIYMVNPFVNDFVNDLIADKVAIYFSGDISYMITANDDRIVATSYAVQNCGTFGVGIGAVPMHSAINKVKYLGLNSTSAYIYMIGVVGYLLWTLCLARSGVHGNEESIQKTAVYFLYLLILSYFLPVYSSVALLSAIMLIFYVFNIEISRN